MQSEKERRMKVKLNVSPSGAGCRHVHVLDLSNRLLGTMTRDDWDADVDDAVPEIRKVRFLIRRYKAANPNATPAQVKAYIEGEEL